MIRPATHADIPRVLEMGRRFFETAGWPEVAEWDDASTAATLRNLVDQPTGALLVAEKDGTVVGMTGGLVYPFYFNAGHLTGQELFWWVEPEHRGLGAKLFDALEDWARSAGAKTFTMIAVDRLKPEVMARIYRARGYQAAEHSFIRRL